MIFIKCFMGMFSKYHDFWGTFFSIILEPELGSNFALYKGLYEHAWITVKLQ